MSNTIYHVSPEALTAFTMLALIAPWYTYIYGVFHIQPEFFCSLLNFVLAVLRLFLVLL